MNEVATVPNTVKYGNKILTDLKHKEINLMADRDDEVGQAQLNQTSIIQGS